MTATRLSIDSAPESRINRCQANSPSVIESANCNELHDGEDTAPFPLAKPKQWPSVPLVQNKYEIRHGYVHKRSKMSHKLLNTAEAAIYLSMSKAFLDRDRWAGARIPFIKVGSRAVRYRRTDLDKNIESQIRYSTSQQDPQ